MIDAGTEALDLLTIGEVATRLRLSVRTVRRKIDAGEIEAVKVGVLVRIAPEAVLAYKQMLRTTALVVPAAVQQPAA